MTQPCGIDTDTAANITATTTLPAGVLSVSQNDHDYWPNTLYDTREAQTRDGLADTTDLTLSGVIHYVELDVNNLRRWLAGQFAAAPYGAPNGPNAKNDNGYIIYFSDRRNNKNAAGVAGVETGEYGFEDVTNPAAAGGAANNAMDGAGCLPGHVAGEPLSCLEDFNDNHVLDTYGRARSPTLNRCLPRMARELDDCVPRGLAQSAAQHGAGDRQVDRRHHRPLLGAARGASLQCEPCR